MVLTKDLYSQFYESTRIWYSIVSIFWPCIDTILNQIIIFTRLDCKITTVQPNLTFLISFERRDSYLLIHCWMDNFEEGDEKLQSK